MDLVRPYIAAKNPRSFELELVTNSQGKTFKRPNLFISLLIASSKSMEYSTSQINEIIKSNYSGSPNVQYKSL